MKILRKIIEIDEALCNGCGECVPSCKEGAIQIINGKAKLVAEKYCDGLGACLGECPTGALKVVEREADDFNEDAVAVHLAKQQACPGTTPQGGGCPSSRMQSFSPKAATIGDGGPSALTHWPVQIRLVPPTAPFLQGARLLVTADCVPVAYAGYHKDFLADRVVLMGCPKFDDIASYQQRFEQVFAANDITDVTVLVMQVPCCQGLPHVVEQAMEAAGRYFPLEVVTISLEGEVLRRRTVIGPGQMPAKDV